MNPISVLTGTLQYSGTTPELAQVNVVLPLIPQEVFTWVFALLLIYFFFLTVQKFEMWALTVCLLVSILYIPFALTGFAPYVVLLDAIFVFLVSFSHVFVKALTKKVRS